MGGGAADTPPHCTHGESNGVGVMGLLFAVIHVIVTWWQEFGTDLPKKEGGLKMTPRAR